MTGVAGAVYARGGTGVACVCCMEETCDRVVLLLVGACLVLSDIHKHYYAYIQSED